MGCASSKPEDTEAVVLCRKRLSFLDEALRQRYAFAEAHFAYLHSLSSVGDSLHHLFHSAGNVASSAAHFPSPVLNLPSHRRKADPEREEREEEEDEGGEVGHHLQSSGSPSHIGSGHHLSHSSSGSHIHFHSDEEEFSGSDQPHQLGTGNSSPPRPRYSSQHQYQQQQQEQGMFEHEYGGGLGMSFNPPPYPAGGGFMGGGGGGYTNTTMHMNFMKKQPTPSVSYQHKPLPPESIQMGIANPPYYNHNHNNPYPPNQNPNSYYYGDPYASAGGSMAYGGELFGVPPSSSSKQQQQQQQPPPPPPPPPPSTSPWDMLNFFDNIEANYPPYTPSRASRDSREVREEEGIPDLEDEDFQHEVVKEVHGDQKLVDAAGTSSDAPARNTYLTEADTLYRPRPSVLPDPDPVEYEVHMVDKKVVGERARGSEEHTNVNVGARGGGFRNVSEVVRAIQVQFQLASASGGELAKMLEVGKLPFNLKTSAYQVSSKMLGAIAPSLPSTSRDSEASSSVADVDEDMGLSSRSLSSTLQKLYLWEKKLFEEVKVEEKMRVAHDKKMVRLQRLDDKGAEAHKIDATRTTIRNLSTKITISIQIIDKISVKISKLRDEDLWLQLNALIQGLARMWRGMVECHHSQFQAVEGARGLDAIAFSKNPSDSHLEAVVQLEHELINWTSRFSNWIDTQKGYVKALNDWLLHCISYVPEETADGIAPFSPGRAGAPPVFVICYQWAQALDRLSEKEVVDSMRAFAAMLLQFWERDKVEIERKVKDLEREDIKLQKQILALDKKMIPASTDPNTLSLSGNVVYQSDTSNKASLQAGLQHIFEAMDRYTSESLKVYEELLSRSEEVVRERASV